MKLGEISEIELIMITVILTAFFIFSIMLLMLLQQKKKHGRKRLAKKKLVMEEALLQKMKKPQGNTEDKYSCEAADFAGVIANPQLSACPPAQEPVNLNKKRNTAEEKRDSRIRKTHKENAVRTEKIPKEKVGRSFQPDVFESVPTLKKSMREGNGYKNDNRTGEKKAAADTIKAEHYFMQENRKISHRRDQLKRLAQEAEAK